MTVSGLDFSLIIHSRLTKTKSTIFCLHIHMYFIERYMYICFWDISFLIISVYIVSIIFVGLYLLKDRFVWRIRFRCDQVGQFDQIFNFELLNSRRIYQLYCRGICALPSISREPRYVCVLTFVLKGKNLNKSIIFHITYVI